MPRTRAEESRRLEIKGPAGAIEAVVDEGGQLANAVLAHPHPLYGGSMDNAVVLALNRVWARNATALRFNFRGVGASAGEHDGGAGEVEDLVAAIEELERLAEPAPLWLAGYSFGAVMVLQALRDSLHDAKLAGSWREHVAGALVVAPPLSHYDFSWMAGNELPVAVVVGGADDLTPRELAESELGRWGGVRAIEWIEGAGHDLGTQTSSRPLESAVRRVSDALGYPVASRESASGG